MRRTGGDRVAYSREQKHEAIALGRTMGAEAAAEQLHILPRTIRKWMEAAGDPPELAGNASVWQRHFDLASARVERFLTTGKVTAVQAATIAAIAARNMRDAKPAGETPAVNAQETFRDWLVDTVAVGLNAEALGPTVEAIEQLTPELLRRANAEVGQPHRPAMLAWFSGRLEIPADGVMEWAREQTKAILAEHGTLSAWLAHHRAEMAAREPELPPSVVELIARARTFLDAPDDEPEQPPLGLVAPR
jgi:transposase-like protein